MSLDDFILSHEDQIRKLATEVPDLRLLLITSSQWLRVYKNKIEKFENLKELYFVRGLKPKRGELLNYFAKLEFLVNELLQTRFLGLLSEKAYEFDELLEFVDFSYKIRLLKRWKIISNNQVERISELFKVRNELAHRWNEYEVLYGKDESGNRLSITENIEKFKVDAEKIWIELIEIYMKEQEKGKGLLISKIEDPNTINIWEEVSRASREAEKSENSGYRPPDFGVSA